jgi:hypothetical protein
MKWNPDRYFVLITAVCIMKFIVHDLTLVDLPEVIGETKFHIRKFNSKFSRDIEK